MSTRDWKLRIEDILDAIGRIERYTEGFHYRQWQKDQKTIDAVTRNFEIIGEAATHVLRCRCGGYLENYSGRSSKTEAFAYRYPKRDVKIVALTTICMERR